MSSGAGKCAIDSDEGSIDLSSRTASYSVYNSLTSSSLDFGALAMDSSMLCVGCGRRRPFSGITEKGPPPGISYILTVVGLPRSEEVSTNFVQSGSMTTLCMPLSAVRRTGDNEYASGVSTKARLEEFDDVEADVMIGTTAELLLLWL